MNQEIEPQGQAVAEFHVTLGALPFLVIAGDKDQTAALIDQCGQVNTGPVFRSSSPVLSSFAGSRAARAGAATNPGWTQTAPKSNVSRRSHSIGE